MDYIKEIKGFYDCLETDILSPSCIALWHGLMYINCRAGWKSEFTVSMVALMTKTGLTRKTIERSRNVLQEKGFIKWEKRKGSQSSSYTLYTLAK